MMKTISKVFAASALAVALGLAGATASAAVLSDFTVDESSVPGNVGAGSFSADKMNGAYTELISFTGGGNFVTNAYADFGQFLTNDGSTNIVGTQLNTSYGLYALFQSTGTVAGNTFTGANGQFSLWIDPNQDTVKSFAAGDTGADAPNVVGNADDYRIAISTDLTAATGVLVPGIGGFFDFIFDNFTLDAPGEDYFTLPRPFYLRVNVDGDFDDFALEGTQSVNGDVSAVFVVPEPGSLALLGASLLAAFGVSRRRQQ